MAPDPARDGQPPIMLEDLVAVDEIVKSDPGWRAAMPDKPGLARRSLQLGIAATLVALLPLACWPG